MYWFTKNGKETNRATYEFWGDTDADILSIPKHEYVPYSCGIALNGGDTTLWICDGNKVWYKAGSLGDGGSGSGSGSGNGCCGGGSGSGGSYDDTLILKALAEIQEKLTEAEGDIDAIKEIMASYEDKFADIDKRLTALEKRGGSSMGDCDCVQHSILNGNWDGIPEETPDEPDPEQPDEPEPGPDEPNPPEEVDPSTWEAFNDYCLDNWDKLLGTVVNDNEGAAALDFVVVHRIDDEGQKTVVLQSAYAIPAVPYNNNGYNGWEDSTLKQYMEGGDNWYTPKHEGDVAPEDAPASGFMNLISDDLRARVSVATIPSIANLDGNDTSEVAFEYYKPFKKTNSAAAKRVYNLKDGTTTFVALKDSNNANDNQRAYVKKNGEIVYSNVANNTPITPVIHISLLSR